LQQWKDGVVKKLTQGVHALCQGNKISIIAGEATFQSSNELVVRTHNGSTTLSAPSIVIATGSRPMELPAFAFDGQVVLSSREALELTKVPEHLGVIGGGAIGLEIGTVYAKLGSQVTVIELMEQLLPGTDPELVEVVSEGLTRRGVTCYLQSVAKEIRKEKGHTVLVGECDGEEFTARADTILLTVGRRPNTEALGLEQTSVQLDEKGFVQVDEQLRTVDPSIFAIGDVAGLPLLAHKASKEALVAAEVIAGMSSRLDYEAMPAAIFTDPEIATVGLTEEEALQGGYDIAVGRFPFAASGRALSTGSTDGFVKLVSDRESGLILGVHIVGADASNLISEAALGIEMGASVEDLALTVHPHPTLPESLMEAAEAAAGHAIHLLNR